METRTKRKITKFVTITAILIFVIYIMLLTGEDNLINLAEAKDKCKKVDEGAYIYKYNSEKAICIIETIENEQLIKTYKEVTLT